MSTAGYFIEDLKVGMEAAHEKTVTDKDVNLFADISGDTNPVHLDENYASGTMFKTRIAHGMLTASLISTILGTKLPGPGSIYLTQSLKFKAPVRLGDTVKVLARITDLAAERRHAVLACECKVGDKIVLEGEARVMVPSRAD